MATRPKWVLAAMLTMAGVTFAQSRRSRSEPPASFDYYVLALSWAPEFCAQPGAAAENPMECEQGRTTGFIVHGLWPEEISGHAPENCGRASRVPKSIVNFVIRYMPSPSLIQHEWATHGVCTGLNAQDYFSAIITTRSAVQFPVQLTSIDRDVRKSPADIETEFAGANPNFPKGAFRTSCPRDELSEVRVCFDKNLKPRACPASAGECIKSAVVVKPPV